MKIYKKFKKKIKMKIYKKLKKLKYKVMKINQNQNNILK